MSKYVISCKNMQHVINFNATLSLTAVCLPDNSNFQDGHQCV